MEKILLVLVIAAIVIGPERLPLYAAKLGQFVRQARRMLRGAKQQLQDELGDEFKDVDWRQYDPRQYDPRRIIRDAWLEDQAAEARENERAAGQERAAAMPHAAQLTADGATIVAASGAALAALALHEEDSAFAVPFDTEAT